MRPLLLAVLPLTLLTGCLTGDNYPAQYGNAVCRSLYQCAASESDIEAIFGYDDESECREDQEEAVASGAAYDAYEEGDREFDADAAVFGMATQEEAAAAAA